MAKVVSGNTILASAIARIGDVKPLKDGSVKVPLSIGKANLNTKRVGPTEENPDKKDTLSSIWWNLRFKMRKSEDARYGIFQAIRRMPLDNINGKAFLILTGDEMEAIRAGK